MRRINCIYLGVSGSCLSESRPKLLGYFRRQCCLQTQACSKCDLQKYYPRPQPPTSKPYNVSGGRTFEYKFACGKEELCELITSAVVEGIRKASTTVNVFNHGQESIQELEKQDLIEDVSAVDAQKKKPCKGCKKRRY